ncbi:EAL and HDOD domain-containing protein [Alkalimarinus alittae]|uniref:HDOD domain-containing protein n=1 Tax=Alkalimarinus alittae TaxID=2961619 RepID=A0ABY6N6G7_9ALTE|nr:HDOD domain-containing protein [Alkalimarinus alittae]UZE97721.1 HDOD domain-containing protein [Alkalimarinus alittae]
MTEQNVLLARQPIYDTQQELVAYELLFRPEDKCDMPNFDGNIATSRVLLNAFTEGDIEKVTGNKPAFVNFTKELLLAPPPFNPELIVVEVLEDIIIDTDVVDAIKNLKHKGYRIALDDFVMDERYKPLLPLADIIKLELPAMNADELKSAINHLRQFSNTLLAEKIETIKDYNLCKGLGCDLFQGYFLSKPEIIKGQKLPQNKLAVLQLISELQNPAVNVTELNAIISKDPTLSFKLLKLVNSAAYRRAVTIDSIHMAVMMIGISKIKSWSSLLALSKMDDKPVSLRQISLARARLCELLSQKLSPDQPDLYFTTGLLSSLDIYFDTPLKELLLSLPLEATISDALIHYRGKAGLAIHTAKHYEQSKWQAIHWNLLERFGISKIDLNRMYIESVTWAGKHTEE